MGRLARCALLAALVVAFVPASAGARTGPQSVGLSSSGALVVRWQSNPDTCAASGLCGRSGTLSWRPGSDNSLEFFGADAGGFVGFFGADAVVRSRRTTSDGDAVCVDTITGSLVNLALKPAGRGRVALAMTDETGLGFGRCAGPLGADFASALPVSAPLEVAALKRGTGVDLQQTNPFGGGAFTGEVISTLVLRTHRERGGISESFGTSVKPRRGPRVRYGLIQLTYAIEHLTADMGIAYTGLPAPGCEPFDGCGLGGTLRIAGEFDQGRLVAGGARRLPGAHARETPAAALRALRSGRSRGNVEAFLGTEPVVFQLSQTAGFEGEQPCTDSGRYEVEDLGTRHAAGGIRVSFGQSGGTVADLIRTRCPGPLSLDLGLGGPLATGTLRFRALGQKSLTLTLRPPAAFDSVAYRGAGQGAVTLSLRLVRQDVSTRTVRVERSPF
ncbi:MAG: hypothetical protein ACJ76Z_11315 [Thermoleophilaceae bacterium]